MRRVRLFAGTVCLGVADAGAGFGDDLARAINNQDLPAARQLIPRPVAEPGPASGFGLLHETVAATDGKVLAGRSAEGGALVLMTIPEMAVGGVRLHAE